MAGGRAVTRQIGEHGLFCLDSEDYAAYALEMECNAIAIDDALSSTITSVNDFLTRPYGSFANTNARVIFDDSSGTIGPEGLAGDSLLMAASSTGTFNRMANGLGNLPIGFYLIGATINWTVATPNNNTRRLLMVYGVNTINGFANAATTYTDLYIATDFEGSTGGTGALTVCGMLENSGQLSSIQSHFTHGNTSSTINVAAGNWRVWAMYLGRGAVI